MLEVWIIVSLLALKRVNGEYSSKAVSGTCAGPCNLHPALLERIKKDVAWLDEAGGITDAMIRNISLVCDRRKTHQCNVKATRLMIKDGEVYLNSLHPEWRLGPPEFMGFLLELYETSRMYRLPDLEFAWNGDDDASSPAFDWADRARLQATFHGGPFPLLAWSKGDASFAALVPYSGAFRCTDDSFDSILSRLEEVLRVPWDSKRQVAFGRWNLFCAPYQAAMPALPSGEQFACPRLWLPHLARGHPDLLDVAYLGEQQGGRGGKRVAPVPLTHQNTYRYLVSTDGWAISSKFDKYLLLGSAVIKASSSRYGFYYDALRPGEHYLPCMNGSKDDILDVVRWAVRNDAEAARIAGRAQAFAVGHLHRGARLCYYRTLLEEMGRRMRYTPDCSQRRLCVPLGRLLRFLSIYPKTAGTCRYAEVLLRYGDGTDPSDPGSNSNGKKKKKQKAGLPYSAYSDEELAALLRDDTHWPRDTDIPPLDEEPYFLG